MRRHSLHGLLDQAGDPKIASVRASHSAKRVSVVDYDELLSGDQAGQAAGTGSSRPAAREYISPAEARIKKYHKKTPPPVRVSQGISRLRSLLLCLCCFFSCTNHSLEFLLMMGLLCSIVFICPDPFLCSHSSGDGESPKHPKPGGRHAGPAHLLQWPPSIPD